MLLLPQQLVDVIIQVADSELSETGILDCSHTLRNVSDDLSEIGSDNFC